jgi:RNA polymerase sigma factor (TIGR02999 family)
MSYSEPPVNARGVHTRDYGSPVGGRRGKKEAFDRLFPLVYDELRARARQYLRSEAAGHTLSAAALVHEAYLKLVAIEQVDWQDRAHFHAVAATAMRRVLVSHARRHGALKRGGGKARQRVQLGEPPGLSAARSEWVLALDEALERLAARSDRLARTVELRFFGGLTTEEIARVLSVAPSTVKLDWQKARAWLYRELQHT